LHYTEISPDDVCFLETFIPGKFGYLEHENWFEKPDLLVADGVPLTEKGKSIFGHSLAKLVKRALN